MSLTKAHLTMVKAVGEDTNIVTYESDSESLTLKPLTITANPYIISGNYDEITGDLTFVMNDNSTVVISGVLTNLGQALRGPAGKDGEDGKDGREGKDGADGKDGKVGKQGDRGSRGVQGDQGPKGDTGIPGPEGQPGPPGPEGSQGLPGQQGEKGDKGDQGDQGDQGPTGYKGIKGDQGSIGQTGLQGIQGKQGDQGIPGPPGPIGPSGEQGPPGPIGSLGYRGVDGLGTVVTRSVLLRSIFTPVFSLVGANSWRFVFGMDVQVPLLGGPTFVMAVLPVRHVAAARSAYFGIAINNNINNNAFLDFDETEGFGDPGHDTFGQKAVLQWSGWLDPGSIVNIGIYARNSFANPGQNVRINAVHDSKDGQPGVDSIYSQCKMSVILFSS